MGRPKTFAYIATAFPNLPEELLEDIFQEALLAVWQNHYAKGGTTETEIHALRLLKMNFLWQLSRHKDRRDALKRQGDRNALSIDEEVRHSDGGISTSRIDRYVSEPSAEDVLLSQDLTHEFGMDTNILSVLKMFNPLQQRTLQKKLAGMSHQEIADETGVTPQAVSQRLRWMREKAERYLSESY